MWQDLVNSATMEKINTNGPEIHQHLHVLVNIILIVPAASKSNIATIESSVLLVDVDTR